jgi:glycosyltransferase involved in cell wall biosynthesis
MATRKPSKLAVVVRVHGPNAIIRANKRKGIRTSLRDGLLDVFVRRSLLAADAISVPSAGVWDDLQSQFKIRREDFSVLPCPVAPKFFRPGSVRTSQPLILCVGRLGWVKGDDVLIRAAPDVLERFPDVTLRFAGESHDTESVVLRSRLPDPIARRIEFLGQVNQNEIVALLECARVCAFPSRWESFGIACAEAMAAERPVVVSDAPGFTALVSNGVTGLVVRREDSEALANAICRILDSEDLRQRLAVAGRKHIQHLCDQAAVARKAMEIYSIALKRVRSTAQPHKADDAE